MGGRTMRITESTVAMAAQHSLSQRTEKFESVRLWERGKPVEQEGDISWMQKKGDRLELSDEAKKILTAMRERNTAQNTPQEAGLTETQAPEGEMVLFELAEEDKRKIRLIEQFLAALTGKTIKLQMPEKITLNGVPSETGLPGAQQSTAPPPPAREGWGFEYHGTETYYEREEVSFAAQGLVKTADGKSIAFDVKLNMSREFMTQESITLKAGDALIDPLVINYAGPAAELTGDKFEFDLNADGVVEKIPFLKSGSGFLALDKNEDGKINDGAELFGPQTGNGFDELASYDDDGNQWIDEGDKVYEQLRIWTKDTEDKDQMTTLQQAGVGAIFLGNAEAEFGMKDQANQLLGQMRRAGVYLKENGGAGTVQQIDLAV